jgi:GAF domain-containing protein
MHYTRLPDDFIDRLRDLLCTVRTEQMLMRSNSETHRLTRIVRLAMGQTGAAAGLLYLVNDDRGDLQVAAAAGTQVEPLVGEFIARTGLTGFAIEDGNPIAVADRPDEPSSGLRDDIDRRAGIETRNLLALPLVVHGRACGALELRNHPDERGFGPDDIALAGELAYLAAAAVEEYRGDRFLFALFAGALPHALSAERDGERDGLTHELQRWLAELGQSPAWRRQVELAAMVRDLCGHGEQAVVLARNLLQAILERERLAH